MTPIQAATKKWFEMEGWVSVIREGYGYSYRDPKGNGHEELPTIDANYFFSVVVGRMRGLGLIMDTHHWVDRFCEVRFTNIDRIIAKVSDESIVLAGLNAAIAAREEMGV